MMPRLFQDAAVREYAVAGSALLAVFLALVSAACDSVQSCHRDEDCADGRRCNPATNQCYTPDVDAGDAGPDAGDAGPDAADAGDATTCGNSSECATDEAPICVVDTCEPCTNPTQCFDKNPNRPLCEGGQCHECNNSTDLCTSETSAVCNAGTCEPCQNGSTECETPFPLLPVCLAGECVQCITSVDDCSGGTPICDPTTHACRECEAHSECDFLTGADTGICDWDTRRCVAAADTIYVDVNGACLATNPGTQLAPRCQIHQAWSLLSATRNTIFVAAGTYEPISVNNSNLPRILTRASAEITFTNTQSIIEVSSITTELLVEGFVIHDSSGAGNYGVECFNSATVTLLNNEIHDNTSGGVNASGCTLTMDSNVVHTNSGGGIDASGGTLTMDSNVVHTNSGGGILVTNSDFTITNNIVYSNGAGQANWGGVNILLPGTTHVFAHNTVVSNFTSGAVHAGVVCGSAVELINSINWGNTNSSTATGCSYTNCWVEANFDPDPDLDADRKLNFNSPCIGAGQAYPAVSLDIDGESRDAANPDIGADEYYP